MSQYFDTFHWVLYAVAAVTVTLNHAGPALLSRLWAWRSKGGTVTPIIRSSPTRRDVLDYLDLSYTFFDSIHCEDGKNAINMAVGCAFKEHTPPPQAEDAK